MNTSGNPDDYDVEKIASMYEQGMLAKDMAEEMDCKPHTMREILRKMGIPAHRSNRPFSSKYDLVLVQKMYEGGEPMSEIVQSIGATSPTTVNFLLRRLKVPVRKSPERDSSAYRTYDLDQGFFSSIDTERKAYWLGFILADGNVYKDRLTIGLQIGDVEHLKKLLVDLGSNAPVHRGNTSGYSDKEQCRIRLNSKQLIADLEKLGVVPRKSTLEVAPIDQIPEELRRHFWRGVVDGDGWVTDPQGKAKKGRVLSPKVGLVGSEKICEQFRDWVSSVGEVTTRVTKRTGCENLYALVHNRRDLVHSLLWELYGNCDVALDRKKARALAWGFTYEPIVHKGAPKLSDDQVREMRRLFSEGYTNAQLTRKFNLGKNVALWVTSGKGFKWVV